MPISMAIALSVIYWWCPTAAVTVTYSEVVTLGGSCFPRDFCSRGRSEKLDNLWGNYTCECGRHCTIHNTCCVNSPFVTEVQNATRPSAEKCQKIQFVSRPVRMVSECSERWRDSSLIESKCEKDEDTINDPMGKAPVTSRSTGVSYKNTFCAFCNFDSNNTLLWNVGFTGGQGKNILLEDLHFNSEQNTWGIMEQGTFLKLSLRFSVPGSLNEIIKPCYPGIISRCPSSRTNPDLQRKCKLYYSPIRVLSEGKLKMYRNIHCALCNVRSAGENLENTRPSLCNIIMWLIMGGSWNTSRMSKQKKLDGVCPLPMQSRVRNPLSFVTMFDVNLHDGEKVGKIRHCGESELYDPFFDKCRSMRCVIPGYVIKNGTCVEA